MTHRTTSSAWLEWAKIVVPLLIAFGIAWIDLRVQSAKLASGLESEIKARESGDSHLRDLMELKFDLPRRDRGELVPKPVLPPKPTLSVEPQVGG